MWGWEWPLSKPEKQERVDIGLEITRVLAFMFGKTILHSWDGPNQILFSWILLLQQEGEDRSWYQVVSNWAVIYCWLSGNDRRAAVAMASGCGCGIPKQIGPVWWGGTSRPASSNRLGLMPPVKNRVVHSIHPRISTNLEPESFSRMRSEGSRFTWGSGGEAVFAKFCVFGRNRSQPFATVCVTAVRLSTVASASGVVQKACQIDCLSPQLY